MSEKKKNTSSEETMEQPQMQETAESVAPAQEEEAEDLQQQLEDKDRTIANQRNDYLRLQAEFDTFRRRSAQERLQLVRTASADTIKGLLPILDDCEIALEQLEKSNDTAAAKEGTLLIYNKLLTYLKGKGLARIEAKGAPFDTEFHEAVTTFPVADEALKGKVIDVMQTGYTLGDQVIRYAKVIVGA